MASFPERFPPDWVAKLKWDHFYSGLPKQLKAMVAYLKATPTEKTYSDYLCAAQEAKKKRQWNHLVANPQTVLASKATTFFPLRKLKGTQPTKTPVVWLAHLEEVSTNHQEGTESEAPNGINGMTEEFIVPLARAVKDAQQEEEHCYHCSSPEHFIIDCPLVKSTRTEPHLNHKEGQCQRVELRSL